jgi:Predicted amino acid aldolase or racemase
METPALIVDTAQVRQNIQRVMEHAAQCGIAVRPHTKTHKMIRMARMQMELGACGITCAKLSEAEVMADGGIRDIFLAYCVIGNSKINRLLALGRRIRIISGTDSMEGAKALSDAAVIAGQTVELRVEINTGGTRGGVSPENAPAFAQAVAALPNLRVTGIFTYKSSVLHGAATTDCKAAADEEDAIMASVAKAIRDAGVPITDVSGGSTPTWQFVTEGTFTEIRPGTVIYGDANRVRLGVCTVQECAAYVLVTVVGTPTPERGVVDGGSKIFCGDSPNTEGYGMVIGRPDLVLTRLWEEHGILAARDGGPTNLRIGETLRIIPNHVCTSVNLVDYAWLLHEDGGYEKARIDARGCSF